MFVTQFSVVSALDFDDSVQGTPLVVQAEEALQPDDVAKFDAFVPIPRYLQCLIWRGLLIFSWTLEHGWPAVRCGELLQKNRMTCR